MPRNLWIVRHAQPLIAPGFCYGRLDIAADDAATRAVAARLAPALPATARLITSPRGRCRQLANAVNAVRPELPCTEDPAIAEMDFGRWEGHRWDDIGQPALGRWTDDFARHAPGGGECVDDFLQRVRGACDRAVAAGGDPVVWITHAGVERAVRLLRAGIAHVSDAGQWPRDGLAFGEWRVVPLAPLGASPAAPAT